MQDEILNLREDLDSVLTPNGFGLKTVLLLPKTKRLKQLIKEHGSKWFVIKRKNKVQCFDNQKGLFIESFDGKHSRWVKPEQVEVINENNV